MRVRMPQFDFTSSTPHWAPKAPELAYAMNAMSMVTPHLERFLNRAMARARAEITGNDARSEQIRADISTFIKQESCHYTLHGAFNDRLRAAYPGLEAIEDEIVAHYEHLLQTKSLRFLIGYCEGFECLLPPIAEPWFNGTIDVLLEGAEPDASMLWRWHIMEEFEHRTVCHDAFEALGGSYALRIYTLFYQMRCLTGMTGKVRRHMLAIDRAAGRVATFKRSREEDRRAAALLQTPMLRALPKILRPGYSPRSLPEPGGWAAARDSIERDWMPAAA